MHPRDNTHLAPFRLINEDVTMLGYRSVLVGVIAMLVRLLWHANQSISSESHLAKMLLKVTDKSQQAASTCLYQLTLALKGKPHQTMSDALDMLLIAILCPEAAGNSYITCPTELYVFASFWTIRGHRTAQSIAGKCCKIQFCLRIIYILLVKNDVCSTKRTMLQKSEMLSIVDGIFA